MAAARSGLDGARWPFRSHGHAELFRWHIYHVGTAGLEAPLLGSIALSNHSVNSFRSPPIGRPPRACHITSLGLGFLNRDTRGREYPIDSCWHLGPGRSVLENVEHRGPGTSDARRTSEHWHNRKRPRTSRRPGLGTAGPSHFHSTPNMYRFRILGPGTNQSPTRCDCG